MVQCRLHEWTENSPGSNNHSDRFQKKNRPTLQLCKSLHSSTTCKSYHVSTNALFSVSGRVTYCRCLLNNTIFSVPKATIITNELLNLPNCWQLVWKIPWWLVDTISLCVEQHFAQCDQNSEFWYHQAVSFQDHIPPANTTSTQLKHRSKLPKNYFQNAMVGFLG